MFFFINYSLLEFVLKFILNPDFTFILQHLGKKRKKMKILQKSLISVALASGLCFASPFALDSAHSEVGFSVKHMMVSNTKGKFGLFDAKIDFDVKTSTFKSLSATIDVDSINTDNAKRDGHLKSADFFDAGKYDEMKFVMTSYEKKSDDEGVMKGNLTIKNVTKPVTLNVEIGGVGKGFKGETRMGFTLEGKIDRKDFGLTWNKVLETGGIVVGEIVKLSVEAEAVEAK